jgi:hypothetical protein
MKYFLAMLVLWSGLAQAQGGEATVILRSTITGNQEQPKVLYLVPWRAPGDADHLQQPLQPLIDDVFAPVDRRQFQRELKYRDSVQNKYRDDAH